MIIIIISITNIIIYDMVSTYTWIYQLLIHKTAIQSMFWQILYITGEHHN